MKASFLIKKSFLPKQWIFSQLDNIDITDFSVNFMIDFWEGYIFVRVTYQFLNI